MNTLDKITFKSPIYINDGHMNYAQGVHESTMELFSFTQGDCIEPLIQIEWYGPEDVVHMNIEYYSENGINIVTGYDGVFELPIQAIELLEKNDFDCTEIK